MKLVVGSTDLQFHSFFKLGALGFSIEELKNWRIEELKNWRIEELKNWRIEELTDEARGWDRGSTVAFFF